MSDGHGGYREGNPTYKLDPLDRWCIATLAHLQLWSKTAIATAYGVSRKTVDKCMEVYPA